MKLSKRLQAIADMVTEGKRVADIGTDHGWLPIYLVHSGKVPCAYALDLREGPLERAREHILEYGLEDRIQTRLCDGISGLRQGEVDTIVIAGMGGELMLRILREGKELLASVQELILSPHSELFMVRRYLAEEGYLFCDEAMVFEEGKFYTMMRLIRDYPLKKQKELTKQEFLFGPKLLEKKDAVLQSFLQKEKDLYRKIERELGQKKETIEIRCRLEEIREYLYRIKEAENDLQRDF